VRVEQIIRAWNVACFAKEGLEADDLIASATARALEEGWSVVLVSSDKDLMQLVRDEDLRVVMWDSMRDKVYGPREVREKLGVAPSQVRDYLALTGDTSDNVPGVPGVGPKTAADLLGQFGSLEKMYTALESVTKPKLRESLREHESDARVSLRLVSLDGGVPVAWEQDKLSWGGADIPELRRLYTELEFNRQLDLLEVVARAGREAAQSKAASSRGAVALASSGVAAGAHPPGTAGTGAPGAAIPRYTCVVDAGVLERAVEEARASRRVAVHLETTNTDAMRADIVGVSLSASPGSGYYVPLLHRYLGCPPQLAWDRVRALVAPLLADPGVFKIGHDVKEAAIVLSRAGAPIEGPVFDVLVAAYLVDPESPNGLRELARRELGIALERFQESSSKPRGPLPLFEELDVERAAVLGAASADTELALHDRLDVRMAAEGLDRLMREVEMPLARVLGAMQRRGVLVDVGRLEALGREVDLQLRGIEAECKKIAGEDFALRSRDQLEKILFDDLRLPVVKRTPKGGRSTDADVLEALGDKHPLPQRVLAYRELDKLKGTYIDALPRYVDPGTGRIHTRFDQAVAATGRLASSDPNLQNIPVRTELGRAIRGAFVSPPGRVILSADYSQIELRVLAHLARDAELTEAFASGADVHARTAALMFDKAQDQVTSDERRAAKTINFGVIYGMGESALAKQLGIPREQAARFIAAYFERYKGVAQFMDRTVEAARQGEAVRTLLGRRRFLPNLHSANRALRFEAERVARNTPIQGTAADILKVAMVKLDETVAAGAEMLLTVHDELVFEVDEGSAKAAAGCIRQTMESAMRLDVPLVVDVGWGKSWAEAH
jgi:DNA polymerase-1